MRVLRLEPTDDRPEFSCGDEDLDEFYTADSKVSGAELVAVTYAFLPDGEDRVVAFASLSNDSIKREDLKRTVFERIMAPIPRRKRYSSMPTVKIGRLGVCRHNRRKGIGTELLDYLKVWFTQNNKTGCRFLVVDAYNKTDVVDFYSDNDFEFLSAQDADEETRIMYFDLKTFRP